MKGKLFLSLNLQLFSENEASSPEEIQQEEQGRSFTRGDVAKMMAAEKAKWQKELETREEEARQQVQTSAEEQFQYQLEQKDLELAEYKRREALSLMSKDASKLLLEHELPFDEELLALLVNEDSESTKKAVETVIAFASKIKKSNARQILPSTGGQFTAKKDQPKSIAAMAKKNRMIK